MLGFLTGAIIIYLVIWAIQRFILHEKVQLFYQKTGQNLFYLNEMKIVKTGYTPSIYAMHGMLHGIISAYFRYPKTPKWSRDSFINPHGQTLTLDWAECAHHRVEMEDSPIILLIPGVGGHSNKGYIKSFVPHCPNRLVIFNWPGTDTSKLTTTEKFHMLGDIDDIDLVARHIRGKHPRSPVFVIGVSLGGNLLAKYLGVYGDRAQFDAAVTVCQTYDLYHSFECVKSAPMVEQGLVQGLQDIVRK